MALQLNLCAVSIGTLVSAHLDSTAKANLNQIDFADTEGISLLQLRATATFDDASMSSGDVQHKGENCWVDCNGAGTCDWCGSGNACCQGSLDRDDDPAECGRGIPSTNAGFHECVAVSKCTVTRDGPYTLTRCGDGKVEVGYVMKGFDIKNLSPKAKAVLETVRNGIQRDMARKLGLREDQLVVAFKAGSIIVSVEVAEDVMPASPALGNGQDNLELVKNTPGVAQLVEAGKSLDDCFVDPEPEIQADEASDEASATADPHITSVSGSKFDLTHSMTHSKGLRRGDAGQ